MKRTLAILLTLVLAFGLLAGCGSSNSAIELTIEELEKYSGYLSWIDVCKLPQPVIE